MQKIIGLVGYVNKSELVINLAKTLSITGKKVLVIDGTLEERLRYTIPAFNNSEKEYLTNFDGVDYALGFSSMDGIKEYICTKTSDADTYDIILLDIDNAETYAGFRQGMDEFTRTYFFIEYLNISFGRNVEILKTLTSFYEEGKKPILTRVIYKQYVSRASDKYFTKLIEDYEVEWNERDYELPFLEQDKIADIEMQQSGYIDLNRHTKQFVGLMADITSEILGDVTSADIKRMLKMYTRGRA